MNSAWAEIMITLGTAAGSFVLNALFYVWKSGKNDERIEVFGNEIASLREEVDRLGKHVAAATGVANGVRYRTEHLD